MDKFICKGCGFSADKEDLKGLESVCPGCGNDLELEQSKKDSREEGEDDSSAYLEEIPDLSSAELYKEGKGALDSNNPDKAKQYLQKIIERFPDTHEARYAKLMISGIDRDTERSFDYSSMERLKPLFTGTASEYFRIWIVNTFLTIISLGIYAAWAKVRNRQYIYKNTLLDNKSFDYVANPVAILKGNLIVASGALIYFLTDLYNPVYSGAVVIAFYLFLPFLIFKSLRFFAHNSAYRNIRFRFRGTLGESYKTYLLYPVLIIFTLGLIIPYWAFQKKRFFFDNFAFGATVNSFRGQPGPFYKVYVVAFIIFAFAFFVINFIILLPVIGPVMGSNPEPPDMSKLMVPLMIMYAAMLFAITLFQQFIYAWETNYCWRHSNLGTLHFQSTLKAGRLFFIRITNILAIIFSVGLLIPWAKIRRTRYILDNLSVMTEGDLNDFHASSESDVSAFGDSATDMFDFEIGL